MANIVNIPARAFFDTRLKKTDIAVLGSLNLRTDREGYCFPSYATISKDTGCSRRTAIYAVQRLVKYGYLVKQTRFYKGIIGRTTSNGYFINYNPE